MVFLQERNRNAITEIQENVEKVHRNTIGPKPRPTVSEKRKLREIVRKRGKVPLYSYVHPLALELCGC